MANDEAEHNAARMLGCEISDDPLNPLLPIMQACRNHHPDEDLSILERAYRRAVIQHSSQRRKSGEPYIIHPLAVAQILADLGMGPLVVAAGLLHDTVEDTDYTLDECRAEFGDTVTGLVDGVTKLSKMEYGDSAQAETIRKMVVAMSRDVRVLVVKLSDRVHNARTWRYVKSSSAQKKARETLDVYAPLANRLGMNAIKTELEELSFKVLYPKIYNEIVVLVARRAGQRDVYLAQILAEINEDLDAQHIKAYVTGRPKDYFSIYQKMIVRGHDFANIYDLVGVRIIVDTIRDCYAALGAVHARWSPVPGRFKDYIAMPKLNMYQSLHTTVVGPGGKPVEIQIRTWDMHRRAEFGIAAHWKYKAGITGSSDKLDERLAWVRQLLESQRSSADATDLLSDIKSDLLPEEVFAFTPRGDVINLPAGATAIDFAYAIHSAVGNRMIGAKVNNRIVPIDHKVQTGEIIEIITGSENRGPSRDWLNIVKTSEAKNKIRNWFKKERREENIQEGRDALEREMRRNLMTLTDEQHDVFMETLARRNRCNSVEEMYAAIGYGGLQISRMLPKLKEEYTKLQATEPKPVTVELKRMHSSDGVIVEGIDNCPIKFAKCCSPLPGDEIIGFVTRGFGVSIHKRDCANARESMRHPENADRWVRAYWDEAEKENYKATLDIVCMDRANLVSDVALALGDMRVPFYSLTARAAEQGRARMSVTVGITNTEHLNSVVARLKKIKDVVSVTRN